MQVGLLCQCASVPLSRRVPPLRGKQLSTLADCRSLVDPEIRGCRASLATGSGQGSQQGAGLKAVTTARGRGWLGWREATTGDPRSRCFSPTNFFCGTIPGAPGHWGEDGLGAGRGGGPAVGIGPVKVRMGPWRAGTVARVPFYYTTVLAIWCMVGDGFAEVVVGGTESGVGKGGLWGLVDWGPLRWPWFSRVFCFVP
jgi:hypothetical protein